MESFGLIGLSLVLYGTYVVTYLSVGFSIDLYTICQKINNIRHHFKDKPFTLQDLLDTSLTSKVRTIKEDLMEYSQILPVVFLNLFRILPFYILGLSWILLTQKSYSFSEPYFLRWELYKIMGATVLSDFYFYVIHRFILHHPSFYQFCHSIGHHSINGYSIQSHYAYPLEFFLQLVSFSFTLPFIPFHLTTILTMMVYIIISNLFHHTNYRISIFSSYHHNHYQQITSNYGLIYLSDALFGTLRR